MTTDIVIKNINEVYVKVECSDSISYELRDAFTFYIPGYQFTPQFRAKLWDGKIRLFDVRNRLIYRGLIQQIISFAQERTYTVLYDDYDTEFSINEAKQFINSLFLKIEPRDYQIDAFIHAIRHKRVLLLSPTASGKSFIIYLILRYIQAKITNRYYDQSDKDKV